MKVITLWQPWATLIAEGYKTIETRTHDRFKKLVGQRIGIHAGKKFDGYAYLFYEKYISKDMDFLRPENQTHGAIICTALVEKVGWLETEHSKNALIDCRSTFRYGLFLSNIKKVEPPIVCKGRQGVFTVEGIV